MVWRVIKALKRLITCHLNEVIDQGHMSQVACVAEVEEALWVVWVRLERVWRCSKKREGEEEVTWIWLNLDPGNLSLLTPSVQDFHSQEGTKHIS